MQPATRPPQPATQPATQPQRPAFGSLIALVISKTFGNTVGVVILGQFAQFGFLTILLQRASDANSWIVCSDTMNTLYALLMVIAINTKDEEQRREALAALAQYFKSDKPPTLDAVYNALNSVSEKRRHVCRALVDFVTVKMTAPGTILDGLSILNAYENVKFRYCMYILPFNFTATRPLSELYSIYTDIASPYVLSYRSCVQHKDVFLHMYTVLQDVQKNQEDMTTDQKQELLTLLELVRDDCNHLGCKI
jgi:hypothetical protein